MTQQDAFSQVGVVGAGFMGSGIAESTARAGIPVVLYEPEDAPLERSRERLETSLARAVDSAMPDPMNPAPTTPTWLNASC
jgi:3-hydroxybutyryl-CoA dehydrogenase